MVSSELTSRNCIECTTKPGPSKLMTSTSNGRIRLFSPEGDRSALATISLETTAADLAKAYEVDSIYLQIGNLHIRNLSPSARPLCVLREYLLSLGHPETSARTRGTELRFRHLIAFFLGRPVLQPNSIARSEILVANCDIRRGKLVHRWSRHKCLLYNGSLRIQKETGEDEVLNLLRCLVDVYESRRGRCLRIQHANSVILLHFDEPEALALWSTRCRQSGQRNVCDLSDRKLTLLPESLLCADSSELLQLNLRRNSLMMKNANDPSAVQLCWLDDLSRLTSLTALDLSSNRLSVFPTSIVRLVNLQKLNLSSNCIQTIPGSINLLKKLVSLNLENNWISSLPYQLVECEQLRWLDVRFNRMKEIQEEVLCRLPMLKEWTLAGNYIERLSVDGLVHITKLDLRRSALSGCFRLPSGCLDQLMFLDIRDNCNVSTVHLTNIPSLQVLHCERLQLTSLHLNGHSLTHLHAHHNMLDCLIVMPVPLHLVFIDISYNHFDTLPDWLGDLHQIDCLKLNNNRLSSLPDRLFNVLSLRYLMCKNNRIKKLPDPVENSSLISLVLNKNQLTELPTDLFLKCSRLRHLNVSFNRLVSLPNVHHHPDRNRINTMRLAGNRLDESVVSILMKMKKLKILDLSNNKLRYFDDSALSSLTLLEELNVSSNELTSLSPSILELPALQVLKAHSNRIRYVPDLSSSSSLQLVDMANNALGVFTKCIATGPSLLQLDLTCNSSLNLTTGTLRRSNKKPVALFDIGAHPHDRFQVGFSETSGSRNKLCIRRIHCGDIFGMVDGSSNYELPKTIQTVIRRIIENTDHQNNLPSILLRAHESLEEAGERLGASCMLLHLAANQLKMSYVGNVGVAMVSNGHLEKLTDSGELDDEQYDRIRRAGGTVDENNIINGVTPNCHQLGFYSLHPIVTPKPINKSISITADTDYVIIATWAVWEFLSGSQIAAALATSVNPQVAAKMIQDALQACDYNGNSCVVVIRVLKPELAFGSTTVPQPTVSTAVPPMRVDSNGDQETTLQKIEQRLEKISEVIAKMEDDSTTTQDSNAYSPGRKLYNRIVAEEKVAGWMLSPSSSSVLPPPDPTSSRQHLVDELKSKVAAVEISPEAKFRPSFVSLAQVGAVTVIGGAGRPLQIQPGIDSSTDPKGVALNPARETVTSYDEIETLPGGVFIAPLENVPVYQGPRDSSGRYSSIQKDFSSSLFSKESLKVDHLPVSRSSHIETLDQKLHSGSMPESLTDDTCSSTARSSSYLDIQGSSTPPDREPLNLTETRYYDYSSSYDCPSTSSNSGVYSVQAATRERSFDYYSHTKVRPYDGYTSLEVSAPSRTTTPFLEYASPYRRKMSVIEEVSEGPQRSSSEERVPSASPPPLPDSEAPRIARRFS